MKIISAEDRSTMRARADWFTGSVFIDEVATLTAPSRLNIARVTFTPGARTAWHTHPISQVLHVLSGVGRVQKRGEPLQILRPGDSVHIEAGEKHWHGASPDQIFVHLAVQEMENGSAADWFEQVTDDEYLGI
ncbi:MAG: cupin domain-containing protein [Bdellovibrionota bacterium]